MCSISMSTLLSQLSSASVTVGMPAMVVLVLAPQNGSMLTVLSAGAAAVNVGAVSSTTVTRRVTCCVVVLPQLSVAVNSYVRRTVKAPVLGRQAYCLVPSKWNAVISTSSSQLSVALAVGYGTPST